MVFSSPVSTNDPIRSIGDIINLLKSLVCTQNTVLPGQHLREFNSFLVLGAYLCVHLSPAKPTPTVPTVIKPDINKTKKHDFTVFGITF